MMRTSFFVTCLFILLIGANLGCNSTDSTETAGSSRQIGTDATNGDPKPGEGIVGHQYRAVCLEKEAHAGNVQVLSKWLDNRAKAYELGNYHGDFKEKGHRWTIEERVKSETAQH